MARKRNRGGQTKRHPPAGRQRKRGSGATGGRNRRPAERPAGPRGPGGKTGRAFAALVALEARLRGPKGCPWDRKQTHRTLRTFLLEETYEVLEAIDSGDGRKLAEELGDLLLQVVFHAQIARERGRFTINEIIEGIRSKLVRRHPHVFGKAQARHAGEVLRNWELIKAQERQREARHEGQNGSGGSKGRSVGSKGRAPAESLLDGLPKGLPATLEAYQMTRRAARIGFDWDSLASLLEKLPEEARELQRAVKQGRDAKIEEEAGDLLFAAVNAARFLKMDPEIALRRASRKFRRRFQEMEQRAGEKGKKLAEVKRSEMEELWEASKGGAT